MSAPRDAPVACVQIGALVDLAQQRGIAPEALLGRALDASASERVSLPEFQRLLERAITLTHEPALGLECGLHASEASFGLMSPLISHTMTLRHAFQLIVQFHPLLLDDVQIRLDERLDQARVHCAFPRVHSLADRSISEFVVAGLVRTLRSFGCAPAELHAVCFEHARPAHHQAYTRAFGAAARFGHTFTGVEFARGLLDRPHIHRQPELERLLREQAERGLQGLTRPSTCSERVRALVLRHHADMDMERAARELGLSVRSLRRRLQDEGTSFRALSQAVMRESACTMLRNPELTLQAISHALGFADSVTFHHTFKRWTKQTPTEYRERQVQ
jgi:AraC-like DNA-binding protein